MSYLGLNIRKIRLAKKLTQTEFADLFNLSRAAIGAYEEGRAEAKIDTLILISDFFQISLDKLLKDKLTVNDILHFNDKKIKIESLAEKNKESFIFVEFDKLQFFYQSNENLSLYKQILIPNFNTDYIAFEYLGKITNENAHNFDNSILICKRKYVLKENLCADKFYFLLDKENYYLGKITFFENILKVETLNKEFISINYSDDFFLYEIVAVLINDFSIDFISKQ